jgi:hypothetical protein
VLKLDGFHNAVAAEDVFAVGDDRGGGNLETDGALLLALHVEFQGCLKKGSVLVVENDYLIILKELHEIFDTLFA